MLSDFARWILGVVLLLLAAASYAGESLPSTQASQPTTRAIVVQGTDAQKNSGVLRYRSQWALLIGINKYPNLPASVQLQCAENDVIALKRVLIDEYGYQSDHVSILLDDQATKEGVLNRLYSFADNRRIQSDDSLLVYFSGHGKDVNIAGGKIGFLIPCDARVDLNQLDNPAPFLQSCISMDELNKTARAIPAKHVLFLVDCCYSGMAADQSRDLRPSTVNPVYLRKMLNFPVRQIITAGSSGEVVMENPSWGHSAFCSKLLEALGKGRLDTSGSGIILASELGVYLQKSIPDLSPRQTPQAKVLSGEGGFVFFRRNALGAKPSSGGTMGEAAGGSNDSQSSADRREIEGLVKKGEFRDAYRRLMAYRKAYGDDDFSRKFTESLKARFDVDVQEVRREVCEINKQSADVSGWLRSKIQSRLDTWVFLADAGYPEAQCLLSSCYASGIGVVKDERKCGDLCTKAAEQGYAPAQCSLYFGYRSGSWGLAKNDVEAMKWLQKAVDQGDALGQLMLSNCYLEGNGVPQNQAEGVKWLRCAANSGLPAAQFCLGCRYECGQVDGAPNHAEAVKWYRLAVAQGNALAQHSLGWCYEQGKGVSKDSVEAVRLYRASAEQDNLVGVNALARCYENGVGVTIDRAEAIKWYRKAFELGLSSAEEDLKRLNAE
jgi:TPR repeat protein